MVFIADTSPTISKLDLCSKSYICLSPNPHSKASRCYDKERKQIISSKNVRFLENSTPGEIPSAPTTLAKSTPSSPTALHSPHPTLSLCAAPPDYVVHQRSIMTTYLHVFQRRHHSDNRLA
uniref:Retroviral polymerase SH3-like domain-containing protein n=1 Tax=Physcomitrium patens TaxID=3218 RepID=A0A2K1IIF5_PHYPA|nr:hypothetical protein PHYPA_027749 [Physcomitrium patens]